jgi:hypothetical protein
MNLVSDLDLPAFDYPAPDIPADRYHQQLAGLRQLGWLARSPLAYIVLDHDSGEFFLRSRATAFPGRQIAEFFGIASGPLADHIDANILDLTGERHRRLRALVGPALTPRKADRWRPVMRGFLEGLWAQVAAYGRCDFVAAAARPYPSLTMAELEEALAFLAPRTRDLALEGPPQLGGVEGIYGVDKLPITWSGSSVASPDHGPRSDVTIASPDRGPRSDVTIASPDRGPRSDVTIASLDRGSGPDVT